MACVSPGVAVRMKCEEGRESPVGTAQCHSHSVTFLGGQSSGMSVYLPRETGKQGGRE